jgi:crotonobetainyl-CoA:carnitine CoA-transferase CaiB-like acyl-CoA transferase
MVGRKPRGREALPLSSLRVVEIGTLPAAAYAARLLADFGAEVIKLEQPEGDPARRSAPLIPTDDGEAASAWFGYLNFGKSSVLLDAASLRDSLAGADVLICSLPEGERAALGLDLDALGKTDPALIVADVSWFGRSGPYAEYACADAVCRALAGMVKLVGPVEGPVVAPDYQAAIIGGLSGFIAVMTALNARARGDAGRRMEVSVHEACLALMDLQTADAWFRGAGYAREGINRFPPTYPVGIFPTKDDWIGVTLVTPAQWMGFCRMLGLDDLARPEFTMGLDRFPHADTFEARFVPKLRERGAKEWFAEALERRLPIVVVPSMAGVLASTEFRARGAIVPVRFGGREVEAPALPLHMGATPPRPGGTVPRLGGSGVEPRATPPRPAPTRLRPGRPLDGIGVVDLSMGWAGPLAARHMADLGADIVKVEACQYPDWWRGVDNRPAVFEQRLYEKAGRFAVMNRGKRGITLDLTSADGVRLVKELVRGADAVLEN